MIYVYEDWTIEDVPRCFYVGKGNLNRLRQSQRNVHHERIAAKYGLDRRIVFNSNNNEECLQREIDLIAERHTYVRDPVYNGVGCNYTLGGEGVTGYERSEELRRHHSEVMKGHTTSPETRMKLSMALKGRRLSQAQIAGMMKPVARCDDDMNVIETYTSLKAAALAVGGSSSNIIHAIQGRILRHKGFRWQYV